MASPRETWSARAAVAFMIVNSALLGALVVLSFDPQRHAFGQATGLWYECLPPVGGGAGRDGWSPKILILLIAAALGLLIAGRLSRPASTGARLASVLLAVVTVTLVVVPMSSCIA